MRKLCSIFALSVVAGFLSVSCVLAQIDPELKSYEWPEIGGNGDVKKADTIAAMQALTGLEDGDQITTAGAATNNDGKGRLYRYFSTPQTDEFFAAAVNTVANTLAPVNHPDTWIVGQKVVLNWSTQPTSDPQVRTDRLYYVNGVPTAGQYTLSETSPGGATINFSTPGSGVQIGSADDGLDVLTTTDDQHGFLSTQSGSLTSKGDLHGFNDKRRRFPVGTDGTILHADSTARLGIAWKAKDARWFDTVAAAVAATNLADGQAVATRQYDASKTGGANRYVFSAESTATPDGGFVIAVTAGGRLLAVDQQTANVRQFGALGDGSTDDSTAIQNAINAAGVGGDVIIPYEASGYHIVNTAQLLFSHNLQTVTFQDGAFIDCPENWANNAAVLVTGDDVTLNRPRIIERNASPRNALKNGAANVGLGIQGDRCIVNGGEANGFGYPLFIARHATKGTHAAISDFICTNGYAWGCEPDSAPHCKLMRCKFFGNGWHGFKAQNEYGRPCDYMSLIDCHSYDNGKRDTSNGGSETGEGGIGFSLFNGGRRCEMRGCTATDNRGAGFSTKGGGPGQPPMGDWVVTNCNFNENKDRGGAAGTGHGVELGSGGGRGNAGVRFVDTNCISNDGSGFGLFGGFAVSIRGGNAHDNGVEGITIYPACTDVYVHGCTVLGNRGLYGIRCGFTNTPITHPVRWLIEGCLVSGSYNPDNIDTDPRDDTTPPVTTGPGIFVYSDAAGTEIRNCEVMHFTSADGGIRNWATGTRIIDSCIYDVTRAGFVNSGGNAHLERVTVEKVDFTNTTRGSYYVAGGTVALRDCHASEAAQQTGAATALRVEPQAELVRLSWPFTYNNLGRFFAGSEEKLRREPANVLEFGALGDGTTDDTAAINAAATAAGTTGVVYLPSGSYLYGGVQLVSNGAEAHAARPEDTNPDVTGLSKLYVSTSAGLGITGLSGHAHEGKRVSIFVDSPGVSINHSATFVLAGGVNFAPPLNGKLVMEYSAVKSAWYEVARATYP